RRSQGQAPHNNKSRMKMLFSRWNNAPPLRTEARSSSHSPGRARTISRRQRRSPRYSLFTLSKIKELASSAKAHEANTVSSPDRMAHAAGALFCTRRSRRNSRCACRAHHFAPQAQSGGGERNRTDDLLLAKQALSQLSYTPAMQTISSALNQLVGQGGFEPPTSRLSSARSNQLSY